MRRPETLTALTQLAETDIERLAPELARAEAEQVCLSGRHESLRAERDALLAEIRQARRELTCELVGLRTTGQAHQSQYRRIGALEYQSRCLHERERTLLDQMETGQRRIEGLRQQLAEHVAQKASYRALSDEQNRVDSMRRERNQDDESLELWASCSRSC